jgi:hypothetical protein
MFPEPFPGKQIEQKSAWLLDFFDVGESGAFNGGKADMRRALLNVRDVRSP